jgi:hypothetical protein
VVITCPSVKIIVDFKDRVKQARAVLRLNRLHYGIIVCPSVEFGGVIVNSKELTPWNHLFRGAQRRPLDPGFLYFLWKKVPKNRP